MDTLEPLVTLHKNYVIVFEYLYLKNFLPERVMNENEIFVDVGANIGSYSLRIANYCKNKGVAIEAHPENFMALRRNIQINNFTNVKTINKAVSDHKGFA